MSDEDPYRAIRGVALGLVLGLALWGLLALAAVAIASAGTYATTDQGAVRAASWKGMITDKPDQANEPFPPAFPPGRHGLEA